MEPGCFSRLSPFRFLASLLLLYPIFFSQPIILFLLYPRRLFGGFDPLCSAAAIALESDSLSSATSTARSGWRASRSARFAAISLASRSFFPCP